MSGVFENKTMCDYAIEIDGLLSNSASYYITTNADLVDSEITSRGT
jgi:hypothetical protein